jgi:Icc-related predicted phosphoesterase
MSDIYEPIPQDTEILLTHTPPYRTLDKTRKGKHAGCKTLAARLRNLSNLELHVFGHIHEAHGALESGEYVSVNAAVHRVGQAVIVDLWN